MNRVRKVLHNLNKIQNVIAITGILLGILPMLYISFSLYAKFSGEINLNSKIFTAQIMDQLKINMDDYLANGIGMNEEIAKLIKDNDSRLDDSLNNKLNEYYSTRNEIIDLDIYSGYGNLLYNYRGNSLNKSSNVTKEDWFQPVTEDRLLYYISEPHVQYTDSSYNWVISIIKAIDLGDDDKKDILKVDISIKKLDYLCNSLSLGGNGYVYIINQAGGIIYHPQQNLIYAGIKQPIQLIEKTEAQTNQDEDDNKIISVVKPLSFVNWQVVGITHINGIEKKSDQVLKDILIIIPSIIIVIIMLSFLISGMITQPINELISKMEKVMVGNFDALIDLNNGEKEIQQLVDSYNVMVVRIKELIEEKRIEHEAKRESELNALQAQINPHFLYNTLDSIMWMAENNEKDEVVKMVTALAKLFRISISKGKRIISVADELEHSKNYLLIQKRRYKEKFDYQIIAEPGVQDLKTIKLVLQPLIENAIYHGIEYMVDKGMITIIAKRTAERLVFIVQDNGLGMENDTIRKLLSGEMTVQSDKGSGVGVYNVIERIRLSFGEDYGVSIESELEEGTKVTIELPIIEQ